MKKRRRIYVGALLALVLLVGVIVWLNRGAPSVDVTAYKAEAELAPATEVSVVSVPAALQVPGMKAVASTDQLILHLNEATTEIAVTDRTSGQTFYSNPVDRMEDPIASPYEKEMLSSQLVLHYRDLEGNLYTYSNYEKSIAHEQFTIEGIADGIRVTYQLGDVSKGVDALPKYMSKERFESIILANLPEGTANYVRARYMESSSGVMERLDAQVEKTLVLNKMVAAFQEAGYTEEDLAFDQAENGVGEGNGAQKPNFTIAIEYRLDGHDLLVNVPSSAIVEPEAFLIRSVDVLPYFGSAGADGEGYMLVPDGSGSLIYLNNGKMHEEQYVQRIYGDDPNHTRWARGMVSESASMPVFGLKNGATAWFAEVIDGEANGSITGSIHGMRNSYNTVYPSFSLRGEDWLELYTGNRYQEIQILNQERYPGDLTTRYSFLVGEEASYSGMAKLYREHLIEDGKLQAKETAELPFYLDMLGSYDKRTSFLGVPYKKEHAMTTFEQAGEIVDQLHAAGVHAIQMRYVGWFDRGIEHKTPVKLRIDTVLGKKKEMTALAEKLKTSGGNLYPDVAFQYIYGDDAQFTPSSDAARFVTREVVEVHPYNRALNRMDPLLGSQYLMSAAKLPSYVSRFMNQYDKKIELSSVALRDLGHVLGADYRVSRVIHRDTSKQIVQDTLATLSDSYDTLMVGGHAYAWAYADHLVDVPTSSSRFSVTDESIPFYQMVLHGYIPYAGQSINISDEQDVEQQLLETIEFGASPHFTFSYNHSSDLKFTAYDQYFSTHYEIWLEQAVALYQQAHEVWSSVRGATMETRTVHEAGVVEVVYSNGVSIYVNYQDDDVVVNGQLIGARHYAIGGDR